MCGPDALSGLTSAPVSVEERPADAEDTAGCCVCPVCGSASPLCHGHDGGRSARAEVAEHEGQRRGFRSFHSSFETKAEGLMVETFTFYPEGQDGPSRSELAGDDEV